MNASSWTKPWLCEVATIQNVVLVQWLGAAVTCEALPSDWTGPTHRVKGPRGAPIESDRVYTHARLAHSACSALSLKPTTIPSHFSALGRKANDDVFEAVSSEY